MFLVTNLQNVTQRISRMKVVWTAEIQILDEDKTVAVVFYFQYKYRKLSGAQAVFILLISECHNSE